MLLEVSGVRVTGALDGDSALKLIAGGLLPDVVVSDYRLPGYTGVELIERIRKAIDDDRLPAILMTGDTSGPAIEAEGLANCTVVHKPVDSGEFLSLIETLAG